MGGSLEARFLAQPHAGTVLVPHLTSDIDCRCSNFKGARFNRTEHGFDHLTGNETTLTAVTLLDSHHLDENSFGTIDLSEGCHPRRAHVVLPDQYPPWQSRWHA